MQTADRTIESVLKIISIAFGVSVADLKLSDSLTDDLDADSLDVFELVLDLEREFDLDISDGDARGFRTVGDVVTYIQKV
jgi:acyl carrier protein